MRLSVKQTYAALLAAVVVLQGGVVSNTIADRVDPELTVTPCDAPYEQPLDVDSVAAATDDCWAGATASIVDVDNPTYAAISDDGSSIRFSRSGTYTLTIEAEDGGHNTVTKTVKVDVTDSTPPVILDKDDVHTVDYGKTFSIVSEAENDIDGSVVVKVSDATPDVAFEILGPAASDDGEEEIEGLDFSGASASFARPGSYSLLVEAADSFGNTTETTLKFTVVDKVVPVLEGIRDEYTVTKGSSAPDYLSGVSATDEVDGDLTGKIAVDDSQVDYGSIGSYAVTFSVVDKSGNKQTQEAVLKVEAAPVVQSTPAPSDDTVYITRTGSKYHRSWCRYLKSSSISISRSQAIAQGYTPCSVCNP